MLSPGDRIERYEVVQVLGEGGMAVVYRVRHVTLGSDHALKLLTLRSTAVRARLLKEGQAQARLRHPNVVAVNDVLEIDGAPALLMEFVDGPTLRAWLTVHRPALPEAVAVFQGILAGVRRAHDLGLVHRDLKPANVLMSTVDGVVVPKVADFGLVKAVAQDDSHTRTGVGMGTPAFMAPEQFRNAKDVDHRADVFSLGCMLYALVCGEPPYEGSDLFQLMTDINAARYTRPETRVPDLPASVAAAIQGSLEPDRTQRIPDCQTLEAVLTGATAWPPPAAAPGQSDTLDVFSLDEVEPPRAAAGGSGGLQEVAPSQLDGTGHGPATAWAPQSAGVHAGADAPPTLDPQAAGATEAPSSHASLDALPPPKAPSRAPVLIGAVVAVLGLGGAAAWVGMSGRGTPETGAETVAPDRTPAPAAPAATPPPPAETQPEPPAAAAARTPDRAETTPAPEAAGTVPTPDPAETAPEPAATAPAPEPAETTAEAAPAAAPVGEVHISGGGLVRLHGEAGTFGAGEVPAGRYTIKATFGGTRAVDAGSLTVPVAGTISLTCNALTKKCTGG